MATQSESGSPEWCLRLIGELDAADQRAKALASGLTAQELNWTPSDGGWSVGQCLDHLCVANEVYVDAMARSLAAGPTGAAAEITPGWFGRWFIRNYIEPASKMRRSRAPKKIAPAPRVDPAILDRFLASNVKAREFVRRAGQHDVNRVRFQNPFVAWVRFTVGTGLEILVRHQRRHLLQAERIRQRLVPVPDRGQT